MGKYRWWKFIKNGNTLSISGKKKRYSEIIIHGDNRKSLLFHGIKYRGKIHLYCHGKYIYVVNYLPLEEYVMGVVPKEIGTGKKVTMEALKAQAVVARSYAIAMMGKHKNEGFDICNKTHCQVYGGKSAETYKSNLAVKKTKGEVLYSDGKVVAPYYHAYCGGWTATPNEAWPGAKYSKNFTSVRCDGCQKHNYYWKKEFSESYFLKKLKKNGYKLKQIRKIRVLKLSRSRRITALMLFGKGETIIISGQVLRRIFGATSIKSTTFNIKLKKNSETSNNKGKYDSIGRIIRLHSISDIIKRRIKSKDRGTKILIDGKGYGHGVGLCQNGAIYYSKMGYSYKFILKKYIKNVKLKKIY
jgi:stage II sporulation protein D